jgi:hypothetical protein
MIRSPGHFERPLVTALLLVVLLVSCGVAGGTQRPGEPTEQPASPAPTTATTPEPPGTPVAASVSSATATTATEPTVAPVATQAPATTPTAAPTPSRAPSTSPLATHRLVTYYGHPYDDRMGILGEYDPEPMMARLKEQAAAYTAADPSRPALCTIELIASVAQGSPLG